MKIVCLGDSLTEGYLIDKSKRWTSLLGENLKVEVVNSGISGDTTNGMLSRFQNMVVSHNPTHVIIMGGTNDIIMGISMEIIIGNIIAMTRYARYHNIIPIIGIPTKSYKIEEEIKSDIFLESDLFSKNIEEYRIKLRQLCFEDEKLYVDFSIGLSLDHYLDDNIHPNVLGHKIMNDNVEVLINTLISRRG